MRTLVFIVLLSGMSFVCPAQTEKEINIKSSDKGCMTNPEEPSYPGGPSAMNTFINQNFQDSLRQRGALGRIFMKTFNIFAILAFISVSLGASAQDLGGTSASPSFQEEALPDNVIAIVNGKTIPKEVFIQTLVRRFGGPLLVDLATMELIEQAAEQRSVKVSNDEVEEAIKDRGVQGPIGEDFRRETRTLLLLRKIVEKEAKPEATEEEIKNAFEVTYGTKSVAQLIFVQEQGKADAILQRANSGEDFTVLAQSENDPSLAQTGGLLPPFGRGFLTRAFGSSDLEEALSYLKPGEISEPVQTENGYFIIKLLQRRSLQELELSQVRDALSRQIVEMKTQRNISDLLNKLRSEATVKVNKNIFPLAQPQ